MVSFAQNPPRSVNFTRRGRTQPVIVGAADRRDERFLQLTGGAGQWGERQVALQVRIEIRLATNHNETGITHIGQGGVDVARVDDSWPAYAIHEVDQHDIRISK